MSAATSPGGGRLPPAGDPITAGEIRAALALKDPGTRLREDLQARLGADRVSLHGSGREALREILVRLAERSGRRELLVAGYTCYSVPAAAVAAGLRVRLFDVTPEGRPDPRALESLPLDAACGLLVSNLLGVPEPVGDLHERLREAGVAVIDDAAQCLGGRSAEGPVGARGEASVLSFGRGKPLSGLGGGAAAWWGSLAPAGEALGAEPKRGWEALARAALYDVALHPLVFRLLASIPALHVGESIYDPGFPRGDIDAASLRLTAARIRTLDDANRARARRAESLARDLAARTRFVPLLAVEGDVGVYPRLGVLAPSAAARDSALAALAGLGVTRLYPDTLDRLAALRPHVAGTPTLPGAHELCARLLTLPTHAGLGGARREQLVRVLEKLSS